MNLEQLDSSGAVDDAEADIGDNPSDEDDTDNDIVDDVALDAVVGDDVVGDDVVGDDATAKAAGGGTSSSFVATKFGTEAEVELPVLLLNLCLVSFFESILSDLTFICTESLE